VDTKSVHFFLRYRSNGWFLVVDKLVEAGLRPACPQGGFLGGNILFLPLTTLYVYVILRAVLFVKVAYIKGGPP
jgi:hypothetical protein